LENIKIVAAEGLRIFQLHNRKKSDHRRRVEFFSFEFSKFAAICHSIALIAILSPQLRSVQSMKAGDTRIGNPFRHGPSFINKLERNRWIKGLSLRRERRNGCPTAK
jgi:hypothetical protein